MQKRNTLQKNLILETLRELKNHPSAEMVYNEMHKNYPSISRATVFRNLSKLAEDGEIARRPMHDGADRYDHLCDNHYHVKCIYCDNVVDVEMKRLPDITDSVKSANGYKILDHNIVFSGICPDCSKSMKGEKNEKYHHI